MLLFELFSNQFNEGIHDPGLGKAVFVAGPPGAGKNLIIHTLGLSSFGLRMMDSDEVMTYLNAKEPVTQIDYTKAGEILKRRQSVLGKDSIGLIINITGRDFSLLSEIHQKLIETGYDTFMVFVCVTKEVALKRIENRKLSATDIRDKRKVDIPYFDTAFENSNLNLPLYSLKFGKNFAFIENSIDYGPRDKRGNVIDPESKRLLFDNIKSVRRQVHQFLKK